MYFDWHFLNEGGPITGDFVVELWVDNLRVLRYPYSDYGAGRIGGFDDWEEIKLIPPGLHTVKLIVDPDNIVAESDETNNVWTGEFRWEEVNDWWGEYFNNETLSGDPVLVRDDPQIAFEWLSGSPNPSVNDDQFSARWTRTVNFEEGEYQFNIYRDDGARLFVDDVEIWSVWEEGRGSRGPHEVKHQMSSGDHELKFEMFEDGGWANAALNWQLLASM